MGRLDGPGAGGAIVPNYLFSTNYFARTAAWFAFNSRPLARISGVRIEFPDSEKFAEVRDAAVFPDEGTPLLVVKLPSYPTMPWSGSDTESDEVQRIIGTAVELALAVVPDRVSPPWAPSNV
jgi:hypothetical protein